MLAILLAAVAPALAQIAGADSVKTALVSDICAHSGLIVFPASDTLPTSDNKSLVKPCPWCKLHSSMGIPSAPVGFIHIAASYHPALPNPETTSFRESLPHRLAAPRGPPSSS